MSHHSPPLWNKHRFSAVSCKVHLSGGLSAYRLYHSLKILISCKNDGLHFLEFCENWDLLVTISARKFLMRSFHFLFEPPRTFWLSFTQTMLSFLFFLFLSSPVMEAKEELALWMQISLVDAKNPRMVNCKTFSIRKS